MPKGKKREATPKRPKVSPASVDEPPAPLKPKKSPAQKRAEVKKQREEWSQEDIDAAMAFPKSKDGQEEPRGPGQPSKILEIDLDRVEALAAGGLTKTEIAESLGISQTTRKAYQKQYPAFLAAIRRGKAQSLITVENSMHKVANGYTIPEEKLFFDSQAGGVVRATTIRHYQPDIRAQHLILQKAETGSWKPKGDLNHTGKVEQNHTGSVVVDFTSLKDILNGPAA